MKKLSLIFGLFVLPVLFLACEDIAGVKSGEKVEQIELAQGLTDIRISQDTETYQVNVNVFPSSAINKKMQYESTTEAIFTVNENGVITPVNVGVAELIVRATDGSKIIRRFKVYVVEFIQSFDLTNVSDGETMFTGDSTVINITFEPENATITELKYESSDHSVLTVDSKGMIRIKGAGDAVITASTTDGSNLSKPYAITVKEKVLITSMALINPSVPVKEFRTLNIADNIVVEPADASYIGRYKYSVTQGENLVSIDEITGEIIALAAGTASIRVESTDGSRNYINCPVNIATGVTANSLTGWQNYAKSSYRLGAGDIYGPLRMNANSYWQSGEPNRTNNIGEANWPMWFMIDMTKVTEFNRIWIRNFARLAEVVFAVNIVDPDSEFPAAANDLNDPAVKAFAEKDDNWKTIGSVVFANSTVANMTLNLPETQSGRYLRILMPRSINNNTNEGVRIYEVITYAKDAD